MKNKNKIIIIGLIIVMIVLVGIALYMFNGQQQSTKIKVMGNKTIEEDGSLNVKLSLLNNSSIKNKKINIIITDKNNKEVLNKTVKTNSKGKVNIDLNNISKGKYIVNITFKGDENYAANTTSQKIKIIEKKVVETTSEVSQTTESSQRNDGDADDYELQHSDVQHRADEWEYTGSFADGEHYTTGSGDELVLHDDAYEYYDGHGNVVGGPIN